MLKDMVLKDQCLYRFNLFSVMLWHYVQGFKFWESCPWTSIFWKWFLLTNGYNLRESLSITLTTLPTNDKL